jgi:hypothetical protein
VDDLRVLQPCWCHESCALALRVEQPQGVKAIVCWELAGQIAERLVAGKQQGVLAAVLGATSDGGAVLRYAIYMVKQCAALNGSLLASITLRMLLKTLALR